MTGAVETESMKTVRIREKIKKFLGDRPRNTAEILEHINSTMRHGTTSQQLGNVLSKDKDIVKVGYIKRSESSLAATIFANGPPATGSLNTAPNGRKGSPSSSMKRVTSPSDLSPSDTTRAALVMGHGSEPYQQVVDVQPCYVIPLPTGRP